MAGRNRRRKKVNTYMFPVPFAGIVILVASFALGYVWLGCRCDSLGEELKELERAHEQVREQYLNESRLWARLKSPQNLEKALQKHHIEMCWPRRDQVVRLYRATAEEDYVKSENEDALQYAMLHRTNMNE